ncbi:MAG: hypothetical protein QOC82_3363 [Frankiaceae bacterium]|nr:hypothetical protein [Frankiaceae bacterium]
MRVGQGNDWQLLRLAARSLTGGEGLHLYADTPGLQIGAPALLLVRGLDAIGSLAVVHVLLALGLVGVLWLGERTAAALGHRPAPGLALIVGVLAAIGWTSLAGDWLHVEDAVALLCLAAAILLLANGKWLPAAALVGLAIAVKPWAVLGLPLLLVIPRRAILRPALATVAVPAACWLPFLIADPHTTRITHTPFPVKPTTPVHLLHLASGVAPGWIRTVQLLAAIALAAAVCRRRPDRLADALAAGVVGRLLLDVADYPYYWAGLVLAVAYADVAGSRLPARTILALAGWCLPLIGVHGDALAAARLVTLVALGASYLSESGRIRSRHAEGHVAQMPVGGVPVRP